MENKKTFWLLSVIIPVYLLICGGVFFTMWAQRPVHLTDEALITLNKGMSLHTLSKELEQKGLISSPLLFQLWVKLHRHSYERFLAGTYRFEDSVKPIDIMQTMMDGKTYNPVSLEFTIPEGATFAQIRAHLVNLEVGTDEEFLKLSKDKTFLSTLGIECLEGFLFPATYVFHNKKPTAQEVLERVVKEFFTRIASDYKENLQIHSLTLEEWVAFASLIEKEAYAAEERPMISEVIWRRLKAGIPLGIDAALIYGIKDYNGNITREDLRNPKNLYNNRIHKGLPPTPIASPSLDSLTSVFYPTAEGFYYFVLVPGPERKHHFSTNFKEHSLYVRDLVRAQRSGKSEP